MIEFNSMSNLITGDSNMKEITYNNIITLL